MFYLKHPQHGNKHVATEDEAKKLVSEGWGRWPRSRAEKEGRAPVTDIDPIVVTAEPIIEAESVEAAPAKSSRNTLSLKK